MSYWGMCPGGGGGVEVSPRGYVSVQGVYVLELYVSRGTCPGRGVLSCHR